MNSLPLRDATLHSSGLQNGFAYPAPYELRPPNSAGGSPSMLRPSITPLYRYRNINLSSIDYAFRPRLRIRLTPGGRTFPGKPWSYGDRNFHPVFRYSCLHGHLYEVHGHFHFRFAPHTTLFYHVHCCTSASSVSSLVPIIFGAKSLDQCAITRSLNDGCL